jgi:hypothetical protein
MPKRTVSEKNKTESKRQYDSPGQNNIKGSLEATSLSINKPDLIKIEIFDAEKTEKIGDNGNSKDTLSDKISTQRMFDEYLFEAIDEVLSSLGAPVKKGSFGTVDDGVIIYVSSDKKISAQRKFDGFLIEAIDEALSSLGEPVKNTVYLHLQNDFNIEKNEIPKQIDEFLDIMHKIFGLGASRLEIKFMQNLHSKIKVSIELTECEWPLSKWIVDDISFTEYVNSMRKKYCNLQ